MSDVKPQVEPAGQLDESKYADSPQDDATLYGDLSRDTDEYVEPVEEPTPPAEPAEPPAPTPQPVAAPSTPGEGTPTEPAPTSPQAPEPSPAEPVAPPSPPPPVKTREEVVKEITARREKLVEDITGRYALTKEDEEALITEPNKVLPRLVGRLYVDIFDAVVTALGRNLPTSVNAVIDQRTNAEEGERAFFEKWPQLKEKAEYRGVVEKIAAAYSQSNPGSTREEFIDQVGAMAMWKLGLAQPQGPVASPPASPPPTPSPRRHVPIAPGSAAPLPRAPQEDPWGQLAKEFDELN